MNLPTFILLLTCTLLFIACEDSEGMSPHNAAPTVQTDSTFVVNIEEDIVYADGLSHENTNSQNYTRIPLRLDVYAPDNDSENRPVYVFIHGGGFSGGSKQQSQIQELGNFYAARGWVFISPDYRLKGDKGTLPQAWIDAGQNLPPENVGQFQAIYPAQRDAKAALRWMVANAEAYNINTDYITVGGGSAGAITAITVGISNPEDFTDELSDELDPSLSSTNPEQSYQVQTIIDYWGSKVALDGLEGVYGHNRFDSQIPPIFIAHGTADPTVLFSEAEALKALYETHGVPYVFYPFVGAGHGPWNATVEGKGLAELSFDFIIEQQGLSVE